MFSPFQCVWIQSDGMLFLRLDYKMTPASVLDTVLHSFLDYFLWNGLCHFMGQLSGEGHAARD
jgi:hypothetical protein